MKPNVNEKERLYRTILGVYAMLLGFLFIQGVVGIILGILGIISLFTGLAGWCAIYHFLGKSTINTIPSVQKEKNHVN